MIKSTTQKERSDRRTTGDSAPIRTPQTHSVHWPLRSADTEWHAVPTTDCSGLTWRAERPR